MNEEVSDFPPEESNNKTFSAMNDIRTQDFDKYC